MLKANVLARCWNFAGSVIGTNIPSRNPMAKPASMMSDRSCRAWSAAQYSIGAPPRQSHSD